MARSAATVKPQTSRFAEGLGDRPSVLRKEILELNYKLATTISKLLMSLVQHLSEDIEEHVSDILPRLNAKCICVP